MWGKLQRKFESVIFDFPEKKRTFEKFADDDIMGEIYLLLKIFAPK